MHTRQPEVPLPSHPHPPAQEHCLKEHDASPHAHIPLPLSSHLVHSSLLQPPGEVGLCVGIFVGACVGNPVGVLVGGGVGHATSARLTRIEPRVAYSAKMNGSFAGML